MLSPNVAAAILVASMCIMFMIAGFVCKDGFCQKTTQPVSMMPMNETFAVPEYLRYASKCFSCETDIINRYGQDAAWMGQPSKLFSGEAQGVQQAGNISGGFLGKTMRYY